MPDDIDTDDTDTDAPDDDAEEPFARVPVKQLRSLKKKAKAAEAGEAAMRELAFVKAGVDTDSKTGKLIMAAYDGELEAEAIKAFAADIPGALATVPEVPAVVLAEGEADSTAERAALAEGAARPEANEADPRRAAMDAAAADLKAGASEEAALAGYIARVADAANAGDSRVLVPRR